MRSHIGAEGIDAPHPAEKIKIKIKLNRQNGRHEDISRLRTVIPSFPIFDGRFQILLVYLRQTHLDNCQHDCGLITVVKETGIATIIVVLTSRSRICSGEPAFPHGFLAPRKLPVRHWMMV